MQGHSCSGCPPSQPRCLVSAAHFVDYTVRLQGKLNYLQLIKRLLSYLIIVMAHLQFPQPVVCVFAYYRDSNNEIHIVYNWMSHWQKWTGHHGF